MCVLADMGEALVLISGTQGGGRETSFHGHIRALALTAVIACHSCLVQPMATQARESRLVSRYLP